MTAAKPIFSEIITLEGLRMIEAPEGKVFTAYPSGNPIKTRKAKFMLFAGKRIYA